MIETSPHDSVKESFESYILLIGNNWGSFAF